MEAVVMWRSLLCGGRCYVEAAAMWRPLQCGGRCYVEAAAMWSPPLKNPPKLSHDNRKTKNTALKSNMSAFVYQCCKIVGIFGLFLTHTGVCLLTRVSIYLVHMYQ